MHQVNHPNTLHLTEDIFAVDLQKYVKGRPVDLLWASPDCTSHSKAKGRTAKKAGVKDTSMGCVQTCKKILPAVIIMENVEEIQQWGPLDEKRKTDCFQKRGRLQKIHYRHVFTWLSV